jgi:hypothetical protein
MARVVLATIDSRLPHRHYLLATAGLRMNGKVQEKGDRVVFGPVAKKPRLQNWD